MKSSSESEFKCINRGKFKVTGKLTFSSAASVWEQAKKILVNIEEDRLEIDIGSAHEMDSGGLALLVAWSRWAYCNKKELIFSNASHTTQQLIQTNKLQDILKLA